MMIPNPDGGERPLGIPTIRDRVAQQAARLVVEPIFEADFEPNAYGYRPKRGALARRVSHRKMLHLIKMWLKAPVEETDAEGRKTLTGGSGSKAGTPQGGVLSPLLANIYIHRLLKAWKKFDLEAKLRARIIDGSRRSWVSA